VNSFEKMNTQICILKVRITLFSLIIKIEIEEKLYDNI